VDGIAFNSRQNVFVDGHADLRLYFVRCADYVKYCNKHFLIGRACALGGQRSVEHLVENRSERSPVIGKLAEEIFVMGNRVEDVCDLFQANWSLKFRHESREDFMGGFDVYWLVGVVRPFVEVVDRGFAFATDGGDVLARHPNEPHQSVKTPVWFEKVKMAGFGEIVHGHVFQRLASS
jgi:hypothetical protein